MEAVIENGIEPSKFISIGYPFNYEDVVSITGPSYVSNLQSDGMSGLLYYDLKKNIKLLKDKEAQCVPDYKEFWLNNVHNNILIVDDEVSVNNNIKKILSKDGYQIDQAVTKKEAIDKIEEQTYKLVLLDLKIPGVKGLELLTLIRNKRPETKVIIITGYASQETLEESTKMGAINYLPKPFTPHEIRNATEKAFELAAAA